MVYRGGEAFLGCQIPPAGDLDGEAGSGEDLPGVRDDVVFPWPCPTGLCCRPRAQCLIGRGNTAPGLRVSVCGAGAGDRTDSRRSDAQRSAVPSPIFGEKEDVDCDEPLLPVCPAQCGRPSRQCPGVALLWVLVVEFLGAADPRGDRLANGWCGVRELRIVDGCQRCGAGHVIWVCAILRTAWQSSSAFQVGHQKPGDELALVPVTRSAIAFRIRPRRAIAFAWVRYCVVNDDAVVFAKRLLSVAVWDLTSAIE